MYYLITCNKPFYLYKLHMSVEVVPLGPPIAGWELRLPPSLLTQFEPTTYTVTRA